MYSFPSQIQDPSIYSTSANHASTVWGTSQQNWQALLSGSLHSDKKIHLTKSFQCFPKMGRNGGNPENTFCQNFQPHLKKHNEPSYSESSEVLSMKRFTFINTIQRPQFIKKIRISETPKFFHLFSNTCKFCSVILSMYWTLNPKTCNACCPAPCLASPFLPSPREGLQCSLLVSLSPHVKKRNNRHKMESLVLSPRSANQGF